MFEGIVLGLIQGITEWLPVSSEGVLTLVGIGLFGKNLANSISMAIFLHIGTFFAALIYFRRDVLRIFTKAYRKIFVFLLVSTATTGVLALPLLYIAIRFFDNVLWLGILFIGLFLIITGILQFKSAKENIKTSRDLRIRDGVFAGALQGMAALPGFSRSGLTIFGLLISKFDEEEAMRLSFLMSLPAVFLGNIVLEFLAFRSLGKVVPPELLQKITLDAMTITALITAFVVGFLGIHYLLKIARKVNFAWFVIGFGTLTLLSLLFV